MDDLSQKLEDVKKLLSVLINKTNETNILLKEGVQIKWGHKINMLDMDPERFKNNEGKERHF